MTPTTIVPLATIAPAAVEALLDRAFGRDRHARTAYLLRADTQAIADLSLAVVDAAGGLVGSIQAWPVALGADDGRTHPMVMVGPVAIEPDLQRAGIGRTLTAAMLANADASAAPGARALMLIGDPEYYGRFFGFSADRTAGWRLPGPFEPRRLLARGPGVPHAPGVVGPRAMVTLAA